MTRAHGKHGPRVAAGVDPAKDRYEGVSERTDPGGARSPIPGGSIHLTNHPAVPLEVPAPAPGPEYAGMMAHGVPAGPATTHDRAESMRGGDHPVRSPRPPAAVKPAALDRPVPVYVVPGPGRRKMIDKMSASVVTVPGTTAAGVDAVRVVGRNLNRTSLMLSVVTNAGSGTAAPQGIIVSSSRADLAAGKGAFLHAGMTNYVTLDPFNDELFAVSQDGSACTLSYIQLYGQAGEP